MTHLYNCKTSGDQWKITKFDDQFNVETSYLCTEAECQCPAGHRPSCRHRQMLPKFLHRGYVDSMFFFDFDRGGWVQGWKEEPESDPEVTQEMIEDAQEYISGNPSLAPPALLSPPSHQQTSPLLGGFPYDCYDNLCVTPTDCIINGCVKGNGTPPRIAAQPLPDQSVPELTGLQEEQILMGFHQPELCENLQPSTSSPSPTIRRRV